MAIFWKNLSLSMSTVYLRLQDWIGCSQSFQLILHKYSSRLSYKSSPWLRVFHRFFMRDSGQVFKSIYVCSNSCSEKLSFTQFSLWKGAIYSMKKLLAETRITYNFCYIIVRKKIHYLFKIYPRPWHFTFLNENLLTYFVPSFPNKLNLIS